MLAGEMSEGQRSKKEQITNFYHVLSYPPQPLPASKEGVVLYYNLHSNKNLGTQTDSHYTFITISIVC